MYNREKRNAIIILGFLLINLVFSITFFVNTLNKHPQIQKGPATFVLAGWTHPDDEYGQGLTAIFVHENSTGAFQPAIDPAFILPSQSTIVELNATPNTAIRLYMTYELNWTYQGLAVQDLDIGTNIVRGNITVVKANTTGVYTIFSQQNFTYDGWGNETSTTWYLGYNVTLNFLIEPFMSYAVTINFDIADYFPSVTNSSAGQVWKWKEATTAWVDETTDFNDVDPEDVLPLVNPPSQDDAFYIGQDSKFLEALINISQAANHDATIEWQYYNGTGWAELSNGPTGTLATFEVSGWQLYSWDMPINWTQVSVNSVTKYYVRAIVTSLMNQMLDQCLITQGFIHEVDWTFNHTTTTVLLSLYVPMSDSQAWALNGWYMLLGAVMVVSSTTYITIKVKGRTVSLSDGFYFIVLFMLGWALLIGSVLT